MYEKELLPQCIAIGIDMKLFWTLNPRTLDIHFEAYKLQKRMQDEYAWLHGAYVFDAFTTALANFTRKKNKKPIPYRDKPLLQDAELKSVGGLSDEEKKKAHEALFTKLKIMQANFELAQKDKVS